MTTDDASPKEKPPASLGRVAVGYTAMIGATIGIYYLIRSYGMRLGAPKPTGPVFGEGGTAAQIEALLHVLLALLVVMVTARAIGGLFRRFHQPPVIGEILAGILLGPSLLGRIAPHVAGYILPASVAPFLGVLSNVGVILYMFLVGLELDPQLLRRRGHATVAISHASITAPFLLGAVLALLLYPRLSSSDVPFTCFALFLGVSMSVTAFPVLARILTDRRIHRSRMGVIALTCAAVDDVTAWCLLAFVVSVVQARVSGALATAGLAVGYIAVMVFAVRPVMVRLARVYGNRGLTQGVMAAVFVVLIASALATDLIGIHAVFGAFALGAVIPHDSGLARELTDRLEDLVVVLLLPAFFAFTGMRTQIGLVSGLDQWLLAGLIILVASLGKFGGSLIAARLTGLGWRDAASLGVLMNTRGLMELIVLNIGLELRVISPTLFAMLVMMALVTTFATTPVLHLITRGQRLSEEEAPQPQRIRPTPPRVVATGGVLAPISNPAGVPWILDLAIAATRPNDPPPRVLALVRHPAGGVRSGLREVEQRQPPRAPVLVQAADYARAVGATIDARAIWTDDPAADILEEARAPGIRWLLLGFHRPVFGSDLMGGVVRDVLERAAKTDLDVGVIVHGHERPIEKVIAVVDEGRDGRAALDLAGRIAARKQCSLHAVLVPKQGADPAPELQELLKETARTAGKWLHTDVLEQRNSAGLAYKTQGPLVVMGTDLADELGLPLDDAPDGQRCVVVVQGGGARSAEVAPQGAAAAASV
jgi:Kef-type K+ transport system membrane component KefB